MPTLNPFVTAEQERLRELVAAMYREERPIQTPDLKRLAPFVKQVREEFVENTTPGQRGVRRVGYYMLNEQGRLLYRQWMNGGLDQLT